MTASERIRAARKARRNPAYWPTGESAILVDGKRETIYKTYVQTGPFAGASYTVLESELPNGWRFGCLGCGAKFYDGQLAGDHAAETGHRVEWDQ